MRPYFRRPTADFGLSGPGIATGSLWAFQLIDRHISLQRFSALIRGTAADAELSLFQLQSVSRDHARHLTDIRHVFHILDLIEEILEFRLDIHTHNEKVLRRQHHFPSSRYAIRSATASRRCMERKTGFSINFPSTTTSPVSAFAKASTIFLA